MYQFFYKEVAKVHPYQYQLKVMELLLNGKNVILSVPTGAGKTWASIMPFLYAKYNNSTNFPAKMIYSLPLRALTNSIYTDLSKELTKNELFRNHYSIQTGEYNNDEHFESDIIFSTIDQTLSNFLCFPLSLSKRQANINVGALIGSYLVFDEFHLLDTKLSMSTTLGVLKILRNLCRFCIMTATLSREYIENLKNALNAEVVIIDDFPEDIEKIMSLKIPEGKEVKKTVEVVDDTINAEAILKQHNRKTIVICNRVEKAQQLYNDIMKCQSLKGLKSDNIICLHSRFLVMKERRKKND
jgi:CRISPR-associated endonuclease/helicase Cas3